MHNTRKDAVRHRSESTNHGHDRGGVNGTLSSTTANMRAPFSNLRPFISAACAILAGVGYFVACGCSSGNHATSESPDTGTGTDGSQSTLDASPAETSTLGNDASECVRAVPSSAGEVLTTTGVVQGAADGNAYVYKGIPFAAPPTGELRFAAPAPPECWSGVYNATAAGSMCMQFDSQHQNIIGSEDCLTLNVWTPATASASSHLPVMFFIHGGGHQIGDQSELVNSILLYDGRPLVESQNVVLVTANYRLGPLGYLANADLAAADTHGSTGNYGTLDQIAALKWTQQNIEAFGGDASRVMVFGESAGGEAVCTLLASPLASGLFSSAISESGPCLALALSKAESYGDTVVSAVGCAGDPDVPTCLRAKSASALVQTEPSGTIGTFPYNAVIDGYALPGAPLVVIGARQHNQVPVIFGSNADEMGMQVGAIPDETSYENAVTALATSLGKADAAPRILATYPSSDYASPRAAYVALLTDAYFACNVRAATRLLAASQSQPVRRYVFNHIADNATALQRAFGVFHGSELPFVFGSLPSPGPNDTEVIATFGGYWASQATSGDPNGDGRVAWEPVTPGNDTLVVIDATVTTASTYRNTQCDFWASLQATLAP